MKKTIERLEQLAGVVNLVIEVVDARAPRSTRCDFAPRMLGGCDSVIAFTKTDIADPAVTEKWLRHFKETSTPTVVFPHNFGGRPDSFINRLLEAGRKGDDPGRTCAVVVGLPNVGKSTLINYLIGRRKLRVGAAPGVTRGVQIVNLDDNFLLFDTPGIISPRTARREDGITLALVGCLQDTFFEPEEAALRLLSIALPAYSDIFREYYDLRAPESDPVTFCGQVAKRRGFLRRRGIPDVDRVYTLLVQDFSTGRISGISLESVHPESL